MEQSQEDKISVGDFIIIQRQKYTKLHKYGNIESTATLGNDLIELRNIVNLPYTTTFKMIPKESRKGKRINTLEPCDSITKLSTDLLSIRSESGVDNRNIIDNGLSQNLNAEEIEKLRDESKSSSEIVSQIVENSKSFASKTEYSQEKYLKKKQKKYFEFVQIKRPNLRLITDVMYRQCADKLIGLRMDSISQLISYSGICGVGNYLCYESGTNGLLPAALLNSIGANTSGQLVHMHPGNVPQKQALVSLNLPKEQLDRCISVNIYSILRDHYQNGIVDGALTSSGTKRKIEEADDGDDDGCSQPTKILKNDNDAEQPIVNVVEPTTPIDHPVECDKTPPKLQQQWQIDNERANALLHQQMDALIICAKEHPLNIIKVLLPFIKPSRPIVIFSLCREILQEMYVELKATTQVTNLRITSNWMRLYQVLPNRTHPDVNMAGNSGYLLYGYTVR